jgi:hypothetical protein
MSVTQADAEVLRAMGFRAENSLLDGPRVVLDCEGVYITLVPDPHGIIHWAVWTQGSGAYLMGGDHTNAVESANQAMTWIERVWR